MPVDNISIGIKIRKLRQDNGLSQRQFAKLFGMNQQNVSRYENGNYQISYTDLTNIAKYFRISMDYFFDIETQGVKEDEWRLLSYYRAVNEGMKSSIRKVVKVMSEELS